MISTQCDQDRDTYPNLKGLLRHVGKNTPWVNGPESLIEHFKRFVYGTSTHPYYIRGQFLIYADGEPLTMGEVILLSTLTKAQILEHLCSLHPLPNLSQFQVIQNDRDITAFDEGSAGIFTIGLQKSAVQLEVGQPESGFLTLILQRMTERHSVEESWELLHHDDPRTFQKAIFNSRGLPGRGLTFCHMNIVRNTKSAMSRPHLD
jgi:hypothetical protein